jgi:hypothetical protein
MGFDKPFHRNYRPINEGKNSGYSDRAYILKNLDTQLPSTSELSKIFNVNEFKLKDTFRHFFNTSIYQFYANTALSSVLLTGLLNLSLDQ